MSNIAYRPTNHLTQATNCFTRRVTDSTYRVAYIADSVAQTPYKSTRPVTDVADILANISNNGSNPTNCLTRNIADSTD